MPNRYVTHSVSRSLSSLLECPNLPGRWRCLEESVVIQREFSSSSHRAGGRCITVTLGYERVIFGGESSCRSEVTTPTHLLGAILVSMIDVEEPSPGSAKTHLLAVSPAFVPEFRPVPSGNCRRVYYRHLEGPT